MAGDDAKSLVREKLKSLVTEFQIQLTAWVILDNHYHVLVKANVGRIIPAFVGRLHGFVSHELNKRDAVKRRMWDNYWDTCIRNEAGYWARFNYIHHNPVKHGYVSQMEDWPFSSYRWYLDHKGIDWLSDISARYPIKDFTDVHDMF